jgi:hypothetical protein
MPRPKLQATDANRKMVRMMAACGIDQEQIAARIGIRSPKTLRKHYREEIDRGATDANMMVGQTLFKMATSGEHPAATIYWLKCRAGWKETRGFEPGAIAPPPFIVASERGGPV